MDRSSTYMPSFFRNGKYAKSLLELAYRSIGKDAMPDDLGQKLLAYQDRSSVIENNSFKQKLRTMYQEKLQFNEVPILLIDNTARNNFKNGFIVTNNRILVREIFDKAVSYDMKKIKSIKPVSGIGWSIGISTNEDQNNILIGQYAEYFFALYNCITKAWIDYKSGLFSWEA